MNYSKVDVPRSISFMHGLSTPTRAIYTNYFQLSTILFLCTFRLLKSKENMEGCHKNPLQRAVICGCYGAQLSMFKLTVYALLTKVYLDSMLVLIREPYLYLSFIVQ